MQGSISSCLADLRVHGQPHVVIQAEQLESHAALQVQLFDDVVCKPDLTDTVHCSLAYTLSYSMSRFAVGTSSSMHIYVRVQGTVLDACHVAQSVSAAA